MLTRRLIVRLASMPPAHPLLRLNHHPPVHLAQEQNPDCGLLHLSSVGDQLDSLIPVSSGL